MSFLSDNLRLIHNVNNCLACIFGIFLNLLLVYFIIRSRIPEVRSYGRILLQIAFFDVVYSVVTVLVQPLTVTIDGTNYYVQNGPFKHVRQPFNHCIFLVWFYFHFMNFFAVPVQFIFRFLVLCRSVKISNFLYFCFFVPPLFWVFCHTVFFGITFQVSGDDSAIATHVLKDLFLERGQTDIFLTSVGKADNFLAQMASVEALTVMVLTYVIIGYCMVQMHLFLIRTNHNYSNRTRIMHRSFSRLLFIQGSMPIFSSIGPTFLVCYFNVLKMTATNFVIVLIFLDAWLPTTNACFTLLVFRPFRRRITHFIRKKECISSSFVGFYEGKTTINPSGMISRTGPHLFRDQTPK